MNVEKLCDSQKIIAFPLILDLSIAKNFVQNSTLKNAFAIEFTKVYLI